METKKVVKQDNTGIITTSLGAIGAFTFWYYAQKNNKNVPLFFILGYLIGYIIGIAISRHIYGKNEQIVNKKDTKSRIIVDNQTENSSYQTASETDRTSYEEEKKEVENILFAESSEEE